MRGIAGAGVAIAALALLALVGTNTYPSDRTVGANPPVPPNLPNNPPPAQPIFPQWYKLNDGREVEVVNGNSNFVWFADGSVLSVQEWLNFHAVFLRYG